MIRSPNVWHHPQLYERENRAQDVHGAVDAVLREVADWHGRDVLDVGCGTGFHLPRFADAARSVHGVEPHPPLAELARRRTRGLAHVQVHQAGAEALPLPRDSVDVVHSRTAYFFGPGCEPGLAEATRVLRTGGVQVVVDLDVTRSRYGSWMRQDLPPGYRAEQVEAFFADQGFALRRVDTVWRFETREDLRAVLGIELSPRVAEQAVAQVPGLTVDVAYRVHWRRKGLHVPLHQHR
ncbi:class I SAM-dependent methyltransferase [Rhodococcus sp. X156]|uniref:class I SAM-dependent methyltransferase n=1 Tax=Rhodococcus sp. X156 TaxID=2499145 RepID=UPI000FD8C114|nr:class I SAM-dependent methyltransferase [Rhodococcus sp. X156]